MTSEFIQDYFHADYKGIDSLLNEVLIPIFGDYEEGWTTLTGTDTLREKAAQVNIKSIKHAATLWADGYSIKVFDVTLFDNCHIHVARKGIQTLIRQYVDHFEGALMAFHYENPAGRSWRLSYLEKQQSNVASTSAKRYTYLCGADYPCRTIAERFALLASQEKTAKNIETAFSVEALSDEFFSGYKAIYKDFCDYLTEHRNDSSLFGEEFATCDDKFIRDYVKKLMGRITFLHFLQRKGWLGQPRDKEGWGKGNLNFMHDLFAKASSEQQENFLDEILEPIFFDCLNDPREGDFFDTRVSGIRLVKIPYLNGGLFERDEIDKPQSKFPAAMFKHLFDFFGQYNFTIDENDPLDTEVGVDPEMLGKIFENLLEDNKDKGAFYTPKEIVNYMCREALIAYLVSEARRKSEVNKQRQDNFEAAIRAFVEDPELTVQRMRRYGNKQIEDLRDSLMDVKICDPAIGSGAFPMGLLNLLVACRTALNDALGEGVPRALLKKDIIRNNIYGVDIEKGAIDIARLRFWLSIVVDLENPEPLPNFDYKFMQGNSLLEQFAGVDLSDMFATSATTGNAAGVQFIAFDEVSTSQTILLERLRHYFEMKEDEDKHVVRADVNTAVADLIRAKVNEAPEIIAQLCSLDVAANDQFFLWHTWFSEVFNRPEKHGFDIVIGNPPYISAPTQVANEALAEQRKRIVESKQYISLYQKWDLYIPFMELGIRHLCNEQGMMTMIVPYPLSNQTYAEKLRKMFTHDYCLYQVVDLNGTKIFDNATVSNCIPFVRKGIQIDNIAIAHINEQKQISCSFEQPLSQLRQDEKSEVWNLTQEVRNTNRHSGMSVLGDFCYISVGMVINADERTAKGEFKKEELISLTKDNIHCREYIEAKDIERYRVKRVRFLEYDTPRVPDKLRRPTFRELYDREKLVINCLGGLNAALDLNHNYLHNHSIYCAVLWKDFIGVKNKSIDGSIKKFSSRSRAEMENISKEVDLRFLLGILNSQYAKVLLDNNRGGDYHIYPEHVRNIPIPSATPAQQKPIVDLVDEILAKKQSNPVADTSVEEKAIDNLVYDLYGLTDEERRLVEGE